MLLKPSYYAHDYTRPRDMCMRNECLAACQVVVKMASASSQLSSSSILYLLKQPEKSDLARTKQIDENNNPFRIKPSMPAYMYAPMQGDTYYAQNYAGIIRQ